jgi:hypothetical protein
MEEDKYLLEPYTTHLIDNETFTIIITDNKPVIVNGYITENCLNSNLQFLDKITHIPVNIKQVSYLETITYMDKTLHIYSQTACKIGDAYNPCLSNYSPAPYKYTPNNNNIVHASSGQIYKESFNIKKGICQWDDKGECWTGGGGDGGGGYISGFFLGNFKLTFKNIPKYLLILATSIPKAESNNFTHITNDTSNITIGFEMQLAFVVKPFVFQPHYNTRLTSTPLDFAAFDLLGKTITIDVSMNNLGNNYIGAIYFVIPNTFHLDGDSPLNGYFQHHYCDTANNHCLEIDLLEFNNWGATSTLHICNPQEQKCAHPEDTDGYQARMVSSGSGSETTNTPSYGPNSSTNQYNIDSTKQFKLEAKIDNSYGLQTTLIQNGKRWPLYDGSNFSNEYAPTATCIETFVKSINRCKVTLAVSVWRQDNFPTPVEWIVNPIVPEMNKDVYLGHNAEPDQPNLLQISNLTISDTSNSDYIYNNL